MYDQNFQRGYETITVPHLRSLRNTHPTIRMNQRRRWAEETLGALLAPDVFYPHGPITLEEAEQQQIDAYLAAKDWH